MKIKIIALTATLVITLFGGGGISSAEPMYILIPSHNPHSNIPTKVEIPEKCKVKSVVVTGTFQVRETVTLEKALDLVIKSWNEDIEPVADDIAYATFVDMQRIVRDIYRTKKNGDWKRPAESMMQMATRETKACMFNGF